MKKRIYFKRLPIMFFIMAIMLGSFNSIKAQDITTYQYRHVAPDKVAEFIKKGNYLLEQSSTESDR